MANTTITALPAATTPLTGTEVVPIVQSGVTKKVAVSAISGSGSVTSVTGTSPVASSGGTTPAISLASGYGDTQNPYVSKTANYVLAAPNGTAGVPSFRALVSADIPTLNQNTTGTAAGLSSTLAIASGGTGQTSANAALNALLPSQSGQSGNVLTTNGTNTSWITASGTGTVQSVSVVSTNGFAGTVANATTTPAITLTTSVTGVLKGNGTSISAASSGTDYAPATSGSSILYGNGAGGFSNVTIGSNLTFAAGTLSASGGGGSPAGSDTQVQYNSGGTSFGASSAFTFTSSTGLVTATGFSGALNGTVGATTPTTGVFTTATARSTAVQDSVILQGRAGGTNSYGVTLTPTTLTGSRTLTLPDANGTILQTGTTVTVGQGGTGATTLTGILKGNGTSAFSAATSGTDYSAGTSALATGIVKSTTSTGALSIAVAGTDYQAPISLTTSGSSGAATFVGNTLNIPVYTGGGSSGPILESYQTISSNYSLTAGSNGFSVGPVSVATGVAVTVPTGQVWLIAA